MNEKAPKLARHPVNMRTATLLATLRWLETRATDDALELFDALMTNELFGRAAKSTPHHCQTSCRGFESLTVCAQRR